MAINTTPYPVATIISVAKISQYLASVEVFKNTAFIKGNLDERLPRMLYMERKAVEWQYSHNPIANSLNATANYLWALCGRFQRRALIILGQGGGIIIDPTTGQPLNLLWVTTSFTIGESNSLMLAGDNSFIINRPNVLSDSVEFGYSGSSPLPRTGTVPTGQQTYKPTYSKNSTLIELDYDVVGGDQYTISYGVTGAGSVFTPGGGGASLPTQAGHAGEVLFTDGTNPYWANVPIYIKSANFDQTNGITYLNDTLADQQFYIFWNEGGRYLIEDDGEFTRIAEGGFTVNVSGFDARVNSYNLFLVVTGLNT